MKQVPHPKTLQRKELMSKNPLFSNSGKRLYSKRRTAHQMCNRKIILNNAAAIDLKSNQPYNKTKGLDPANAFIRNYKQAAQSMRDSLGEKGT